MKIIKQRKTAIALPLVVVMIAASCVGIGQEDADNGDGDQWLPISVADAMLGGVSVSERSQIRAASPVTRDASPVTNATISLFRTAPVSPDAPAQYNVKYTHDGTAWTPADGATSILVGGLDATVEACYDPLGTATYSSTSPVVTIPATARLFDAGEAFYYASGTTAVVNNKHRAASFAMLPAQCVLTLSIKRHATHYFAGDCDVSKVELKTSNNSNFSAVTAVDVSKAMAGQTANLSTASFFYDTVSTDAVYDGIPADETETLQILLPQHTTTEKRELYLTIDNEVRSVELASTGTMSAGVNYTVSLLVTDAEITVTSAVKTKEWPADTDGGSGDIEV